MQNRQEMRRVYHGSGADFDAFRLSHIGEGEGAQVYGYGIYVTEVEDIGRMYAKQYANQNDGPCYLYTVEIPDDNGRNYLKWGKASARAISRIIKAMTDEQKELIAEIPVPTFANGREIFSKEDYKNRILWYLKNWTADVYEIVEYATGSAKAASELLSHAGFVGIKYPAEYQSGGRKDGASNYVIFNEDDAKIIDKVRFFI